MLCSRCFSRLARVFVSAVLSVVLVFGQEPKSADATQKILDRLDALEKQNQALLEEIKSLRHAIQAQQFPQQGTLNDGQQKQENQEPTSDRLDLAERRIEEHEQSKVGTSQRLPVWLTGMVLFDSNLINGTKNYFFQENHGAYTEGSPGGGASLSQSIIGFKFQGPRVAGGGQVNGSISFDFSTRVGDQDVFRIRNGEITFDWRTRSLTVGQDKAIIAPLQPTSFAHVGIPALSGAGNLWLWRPQIKYEERLNLFANTQAVFQGAVLATDETYIGYLPANTAFEAVRPAIQERIALRHKANEQTNFSIGIGGHESESHIAGRSVPSRVISADFLYKPFNWMELSGTLLHGENFANLGGLPTGVTVEGNRVIAIRGSAGWLQLALPVTSRLTFDAYTGKQANIARDLTPYQVASTLTYAGNVLYRVGPNVMLGFEGSHERILYLNNIQILANRYDATVAYLF